MKELPYLREFNVHPFRGFLGPQNRVRIRIDGARKVGHYDFTVGRVVVTCFHLLIVPG